jgi:DNA-binding MarR family transcriptional regulator
MTVMFTKDQLKFLDLSKREHKVLSFIRTDAECMLVISRKTKIPRATMYLIIKKLYQRGFIRVGKYRHLYLYQTISDKEFKEKFQELKSIF